MEKDLQNNDQDQFYNKLGISPVTIQQAGEIVELALACGDVPCLVSEAGIGKSQLFRQLAKRNGWNVRFFFLAHVEREDVAGIPYPKEGCGSYELLCEDTILEVIKDPTPTLLVLDEWNRGTKEVMNAAFTMMEDRRFGSHTLPNHVHIAGAMNPSSGYHVNEAENDPAFRRRMCFIAVKPDPLAWIRFAEGEGDFHPLVVNYIKINNAALLDHQARGAGKVYANPAAWEKVSHTIKYLEEKGVQPQKMTFVLQQKIAGHINHAQATEFLQYLCENMITIDPRDILLQGDEEAFDKFSTAVKKGRNDIVSKVIDGVSGLIAADHPAVDLIVENLARFLYMLPLEMHAMAIQKIVDLSGKEHTHYITDLSVALSKNEMFLTMQDRIEAAERKVHREVS